MIGWTTIVEPDQSGQVQALAELGEKPSLDRPRTYRATARLLQSPLEPGTFVIFHPTIRDGVPSAENIAPVTSRLLGVLTEERTMMHIDTIRSAVRVAPEWRPGGSTWLGACLAVVGRLMVDGQLPRVARILQRALHEPASGYHESPYSHVPELHMLDAWVSLRRLDPTQALLTIHSWQQDYVGTTPFMDLVHFHAHLQPAPSIGRSEDVEMSTAPSQVGRCFDSIHQSLRRYDERGPFVATATLSGFLHDAHQSAPSRAGWGKFALSTIRLFLSLGAIVISVRRISEGHLPPLLAIELDLPPLGDIVRFRRALLWIPQNPPTSHQSRQMTQAFLAQSGVAHSSRPLGLLLFKGPEPDTWALLKARALEDPNVVVSAMYSTDLPKGRQALDTRSQRACLESAYLRIAAYRNTFLRDRPVSGGDFFGRGEELGKICQHVSTGHSVLVAGLRKSGKSSLLNELEPRLNSMGYLVLRTRCIEKSWRDAAATLQRHFARLSQTTRQFAGLDLAELDVRSVAEFLRRLASHVAAKTGARLALVIDEIDELLPENTVRNSDQEQFVQFLSSIRAFREESAEGTAAIPLVIVATALRDAPCTTSFWGHLDHRSGVQNPLYQQMISFSLPPLRLADLGEMTRVHGAEMLLDFEPGVVYAVHKLSGGLPMASRMILGTTVARLRRGDAGKMTIRAPDFMRAFEDCMADGLLARALNHPIQMLSDERDTRYRTVMNYLLDLMEDPKGEHAAVPTHIFQDLLYDAGSNGHALVAAYHDLIRLNFLSAGAHGIDLAMWGLALDSPVTTSARRAAWRQRLHREAGVR